MHSTYTVNVARPDTVTRPRVLLVDDDGDVVMPLSVLLEDEGFDVEVARDGREALNALGRGPLPAAILLDLMMPGMSGWEFRAAQLADTRLAHIPTVVVTARGDFDGAVRSVPASAIIGKPIDINELASLLRNLLEAPSV